MNRFANRTRPDNALRTYESTLAAMALLLALSLGACRPAENNGGPAGGRAVAYANRVVAYDPGALPIQGSYTDEWGTGHSITRQDWVDDYNAFALLSFDPAVRYVTAQNDPGNAYNPGMYSRFDWTLSAGELYYCQSVFAADSEAAAAAGPGADPADLASGCGGFSWTLLGAPDWPYFFHPEAALGAPGGMLDVASLGWEPTAPAATGGTLVLGLGDPADPADRLCATDGPGADLVVYENAFRTTDGGGNAGTNSEVALVEVADTAAGPWYAFPAAIDPACTPADPGSLLDPACYSGLAGVTPTVEGGDAFDLADVMAAYALAPDFRACYVRLTDGGTAWGDYGNTQSDAFASGADIDAVGVLHGDAAPELAP